MPQGSLRFWGLLAADRVFRVLGVQDCWEELLHDSSFPIASSTGLSPEHVARRHTDILQLSDTLLRSCPRELQMLAATDFGNRRPSKAGAQAKLQASSFR